MGRGRAKAKQTKVARELKYRTFDTNFSSLQEELRGDENSADIPEAYADLADDYDATGEDDLSHDDGYPTLRKSG